MAGTAPTEAQLEDWTKTLRNWGKWGPVDELGTLNYITPEKRQAAAALVREGIAVSCSRPIRYGEPDITPSVTHFMTGSGESANPEGQSGASDYFVIGPHGTELTHLDALCHIFWKGQMYNGRPAKQVTIRGANALSIDSLANGVVTRGVLLDLAKLRGGELEPGEGAFPDELEAAERAQGVRVEPGDVLLVRTGHLQRRARQPRPPLDPANMAASVLQYPGLQAACLPWLHERQVAMLGCDTANDPQPSGYGPFRFPIHVVGIVFMGLWLLDNCNHEELAAACARYGRWVFQFVLAPLRLTSATGSPVNPLAIF
jgi:kynurenine formamidase